MVKGRPIDELVYEHMFPKPKPNDPMHFPALLQRYLIPEVRQETHSFYGHLETQEAKYPGLDYNHKTHRIRLSRWPWHRRLFRAFNSLALTPNEIAGLTKWEGTKWAKEKFEKEQGIVIHDTTSDGFPNWTEIPDLPGRSHGRRQQQHPAVSVTNLGVQDGDGDGGDDDHGDDDNDNDEADDDDDDNNNHDNDDNDHVDDDGDDDDESDGELESVGIALNARLRAQAARREAGETSAVLDEEWEQWLKHAIESGELTIITDRITDQMLRRAGSSSSAIPAALIPPSMLSAARAGQWSEIPQVLQPLLRRALEGDDASSSGAQSPGRPSTPPAGPVTRRQPVEEPVRVRLSWSRRRSLSGLRLPVGEAAATPRAPEPSAAGPSPAHAAPTMSTTTNLDS